MHDSCFLSLDRHYAFLGQVKGTFRFLLLSLEKLNIGLMKGNNSRGTAWPFSDSTKCIYYILMAMTLVTIVRRSIVRTTLFEGTTSYV